MFDTSISAIVACTDAHLLSKIKRPLLISTIAAGFPSPAEGSIDKVLDLNELLVQNPQATFFVRVKGESMQDAGIFDGDLLVVEKGIRPKHRDIVVAVVDGEFTVKRWMSQDSFPYLQAENPNFPTIDLEKVQDWSIWGVVQFTVHSCSKVLG